MRDVGCTTLQRAVLSLLENSMFDYIQNCPSPHHRHLSRWKLAFKYKMTALLFYHSENPPLTLPVSHHHPSRRLNSAHYCAIVAIGLTQLNMHATSKIFGRAISAITTSIYWGLEAVIESNSSVKRVFVKVVKHIMSIRESDACLLLLECPLSIIGLAVYERLLSVTNVCWIVHQ